MICGKFEVILLNDIKDVHMSPLGTISDRVFLGRCEHVWRRVEKFSKFVPSDTLKMHSLALSVLRFLCKTFSKLSKLLLRKTLFRG